MTLPEDALTALQGLVGEAYVSTRPEDLSPRLSEQRGLYQGTVGALVRPGTAQQVADVLGLCNAHQIAVVAQGGNTGLVGGGVPDGGILLGTERLNSLRNLDAANATLTVEAGCILANVQAAADAAGLLFPLSLASEGSCLIGGNLATNAGGIQVLRYGNARDLVLGLEVALPNGRLWNGLRALRKDNSGYDLKQLFLGSEGTLGVITAAVLKLFPKPRTRVTALAALTDVDAMVALFQALQHAFGENLTAFEMMSRRALSFAIDHVPGNRDPFSEPHGAYALIEVTSSRDDPTLTGAVESALADAIEAETLQDAVLAASETQALDLWRIRETIPEAQKAEGGSIKHDVSVPISAMSDFFRRADQAVTAEMDGIRICAFGHLGDGNIHYNLTQPPGMDKQAYLERWHDFNRIVHDIVHDLGGSFAAEHGVGQLKVGEMEHYRSDVELDLMRTLKTAFDPKGIMNPGKVVR